MDFDKSPPMAVSEYRRSQGVIPGVDALYRIMRAIFDVSLPKDAEILIVGADGGREIEAFGASPKSYNLTGVDPSADMLAIAQSFIDNGGFSDRARLIQGVVEDISPATRFDAATSALVMHFLRNDGTKAAYLSEIRGRLKRGAPYLHVDVSFADRAEFDRLAPVMTEHARLFGFSDDIAPKPAEMVGQLALGDESPQLISEAQTITLLKDAGFRLVAPFFRGIWFTGWWAEAV